MDNIFPEWAHMWEMVCSYNFFTVDVTEHKITTHNFIFNDNESKHNSKYCTSMNNYVLYFLFFPRMLHTVMTTSTILRL